MRAGGTPRGVGGAPKPEAANGNPPMARLAALLFARLAQGCRTCGSQVLSVRHLGDGRFRLACGDCRMLTEVAPVVQQDDLSA